jgi:hypothetical protein
MYASSPYLDSSAAPSPAVNENLLEQPLGTQYGNIEALHALLSMDACSDAQGAIADIQRANEARREAWDRQLEAMRQQEEAEKDSSFWGDVAGTLGTVAKVAGCVAAVALAVSTAGAGTPVACLAISGALASCTSVAQSECGVLDHVLGDKADVVGKWLGIGGALLCAGAGAAVWFGGATEASGTAIGQLADDAAPIAGGIAGISVAGTGAATIAQKSNASEAQRYSARVVEAMADQQRLRAMIEQLIDQFADAKDRETANVKHVVAMNDLQNASLMTTARAM